MIPDIAFSVPDLDGLAKMEFKSRETGQQLACIQSDVGNGKTMSTKAVPIIAAGIAGAALVVSGLSALAAGGGPGTAGPSPSFGDIIGWFQFMATNGMLSVDYPPVYRSFSKNFAFSGLLIPWDGAQRSIDDFRSKTGGNLTEDNVDFLRNQAQFSYSDGNPVSNVTKRSLAAMHLFARDGSSNETKIQHTVHGIQAFVEPLIIPKSNVFMTVLLVFAIVVAAIIVGILLFKLILEAFGMMGKLNKSLNGFRKRYWWIMAKTITNLILLLYGVWTLYCVYQFTQGDSWAAKVLAGVTLALFTGVLGWFSWRVWSLARKYKKEDGDASGLYDNKETWVKYSLLYDSYKKNCWWVFIPVIVYMFARGVVIAAGDGHGLVQVGGQLVVESIMLLLLIILRPFTHKSGNWISISIAVIRVLSVVCLLAFVTKIGVAESPKAIAGVVLVAVQTALTGILAILILVNGILHCCRSNPHRKARKEAEKANRHSSMLTPLGSRNSLLLKPGERERDLDSVQSYEPYGPTARYDGFRRDAPQGPVGPRAPLLPHVSLPAQHRFTNNY